MSKANSQADFCSQSTSGLMSKLTYWELQQTRDYIPNANKALYILLHVQNKPKQ